MKFIYDNQQNLCFNALHSCRVVLLVINWSDHVSKVIPLCLFVQRMKGNDDPTKQTSHYIAWLHQQNKDNDNEAFLMGKRIIFSSVVKHYKPAVDSTRPQNQM